MDNFNDVRNIHREFYKSTGHFPLKSASIIPEKAPDSLLFTTAGMHPLVPYLLGTKRHTEGDRLTSSQKVIRTTDIEEVGDNRHMTFFEMMGNWSTFGAYGKRETIEMSFDFLTSPKYMGLPKDRFWVSVFEGDHEAPRDDEAASIWRGLGIPDSRIAYLPKSDNWWAMGKQGLCGPCSEMFIDLRPAEEVSETSRVGNDPTGRFIEVGNNVFMGYNRKADGKLEQLPYMNIDVGMGLERNLFVHAGFDNIYDTEIFRRLRSSFDSPSSGVTSSDQHFSQNVMMEHARSALCILTDEAGIEPSNKGAGYILRRLIRRSAYHAYKYGVDLSDFFPTAADMFSREYKGEYPEFSGNLEKAKKVFGTECERFGSVLKTGLRQLDKKAGQLKDEFNPESLVFDLQQSLGLPAEISIDELKQRGISINQESLKRLQEAHQRTSRAENNLG